MSSERFRCLFRRIWIPYIFGVIGHQIFFEVQENFYRKENALKFIYDLLGPLQLSLTSFSVAISFASAGILIVLLTMFIYEGFSHPLLLRLLHVIPFLIGIGYTMYEVIQSLHPSYPDNFFVDIVMGWLACFSVLYLVKSTNRPYRRVTYS